MANIFQRHTLTLSLLFYFSRSIYDESQYEPNYFDLIVLLNNQIFTILIRPNRAFFLFFLLDFSFLILSPNKQLLIFKSMKKNI